MLPCAPAVLLLSLAARSGRQPTRPPLRAAVKSAVQAQSRAQKLGLHVGDTLVRMGEQEVAGNGRYIYEYAKRVPVGTVMPFVFGSGLEVELVAQ